VRAGVGLGLSHVTGVAPRRGVRPSPERQAFLAGKPFSRVEPRRGWGSCVAGRQPWRRRWANARPLSRRVASAMRPRSDR